MKTMSATDAKNRFGDLLDASAEAPVRIDRNGHPIAYTLSSDDFDLVKDLLGLARVQRSVATGSQDVLAVLHAYSAGEMPRRTAINRLGLHNYAQLLRALRFAGVSAPVLRPADRAKMVKAFVEAVNG